MFQHTATLQYIYDKTTTAFDFAYTVTIELYWELVAIINVNFD
jgi:hypothetical protein